MTNSRRIGARFAELKRRGEKALIPFVQAGDPSLAATLKVLRALERGGADLIELGVPFSDPMADGLTIQRASERALRSGTSLGKLLELIREWRRRSETPLILFGYFNPFLHYGLRRFARDAKEAGADGVLCVDLPPEEAGELKRWTDREGLDLIFLLAPTSDAARIRCVAEAAQGFIYYVSVTGVTGARKDFAASLRRKVEHLRRYTRLPIGVGFGVSKPEHARWIAAFADAVVVGSALIEVMERAKGERDRLAKVSAFVGGLKKAMDGGGR